MKSLEQMSNLLKKEEEAIERHRKRAADLKKQIELYRSDAAQKKLNSLNLSGSEYDKVMSLLASGKMNVLAAAEYVLAETDSNAAGEREDHEESDSPGERMAERREDSFEEN